MPIIKSAVKRMKQTAKRRERNIGIKRDIKGAVKAFMVTPSAEALSAAQSEIDTAVKKKLIKKATASRRKSGLVKVAKSAGVTMPSAKKSKATTTAAAKPAVKTTAKTAAARKPAAKKPATTATKKPATKTTKK